MNWVGGWVGGLLHCDCKHPLCCSCDLCKGRHPIREFAGGLQVIDQGYAFYWGTSEWSREQIEEAWRVADRLDLMGPGWCTGEHVWLGGWFTGHCSMIWVGAKKHTLRFTRLSSLCSNGAAGVQSLSQEESGGEFEM